MTAKRDSYGVYLCGTDPVCAPCRANEHQQCSWDGDPDCQCTACPAERKAANLAALDAEMDRGDASRATGAIA
jgi:hypothetical protein